MVYGPLGPGGWSPLASSSWLAKLDISTTTSPIHLRATQMLSGQLRLQDPSVAPLRRKPPRRPLRLSPSFSRARPQDLLPTPSRLDGSLASRHGRTTAHAAAVLSFTCTLSACPFASLCARIFSSSSRKAFLVYLERRRARPGSMPASRLVIPHLLLLCILVARASALRVRALSPSPPLLSTPPTRHSPRQ